jgi:crossover junction endodeoxyribonuclease RusA
MSSSPRQAQTEIVFVVDGPPVPKARPRRSTHGGVFTPAATTAAETDIRWQLRAAGARPLPGDVAMQMRFFTATRRRVDIDNLEKLVMDACNGFAYDDDKQVVEKHSYLTRGDKRPRTEVRIWSLDE